MLLISLGKGWGTDGFGGPEGAVRLPSLIDDSVRLLSQAMTQLRPTCVLYAFATVALVLTL